jgi:hypothetical protein
MNRVTVATAALAMGAIAAAATIAPAMAAARPAATRSVAHVRTTTAQAKAKAAAAARAKLIAQQVQAAKSQPVVIGSEEDNYKYVTVVSCQNTRTPPPIALGQPGTPLTASGVGPSAGILKSLQQPNHYKTIFTCTVVVKEKVPPKPRKAASPKSPKPKSAKPSCKFAAGKAGQGSGKSCSRHVTVNTGFGGLAPQVTGHHPGG